MLTGLAVKCFRTAIDDRDPRRAVRRIVDGADTNSPALTFVFVDARYPLEGLAAELRRQIHGPILACTTAGHQTAESGIRDEGMVAATIVSDEFEAVIEPIPNVSRFGVGEAQTVATRLALDQPPAHGAGKRFGVILIDGMSFAEERVTALLYGASNGLPMVGGSAGDGMRLEKTWVFDGERFVNDAAVLARVDTTLPFRTFEFQNFVPLEGRHVVTRAVAGKRQILELDGDAAPRVYGEAIGCPKLSTQIVSHHPLLLRWDGRFYARAIRAWENDRLDLFCSIEEGMVVHIGQPTDLVATIEHQYADLRRDLGDSETALIVAFHCIQRRLEIERSQEQEHYRQVVARHPLVGFCTYGEQCNGLHVNQTATGFILGA
jgi:hypothetical protein